MAKMISNPEWPAFRGADHQARQRGVKFATNWDVNPPELIWKIAVGPAWSSFVVAGDMLFTQEQRGKMEAVTCYSALTGQELWIQEIESRFDDPLGGPGPRATPTLANGQLFAMGAQGYLLRLNPISGEIVWKQDLRKVAGREPPIWGFSSSPLVTQNVVIVHAGGASDKGILAFDRAHSQKTDANSLCFLGSSCEGSRVFIFDTHVFRGPVPAVIGFATAKLR